MKKCLMYIILAAITLLFAMNASAADQPLFRFVQTNDLHVQAIDPPPGQGTYFLANQKTIWLVEMINREIYCPLPDFVVGAGDLINGQSLDRLAPDLAEFERIIGKLKCPFYPIVGNHEVVQKERSPEYLKPFEDAFGRSGDYTFTRKGILFIALNDSGAPGAKAAAERNAWLKKTLDDSGDAPKIVLCHIPLIPIRDNDILAKSFGFSSYYDKDGATLRLIEEHADSIIAVLSGHLHLTGMKVQKGIYHICLSGPASYPSDGAAIYEVYPDRIEVSIKQMPRYLAQGASIHASERHGVEYTDSQHRTVEEYLCGLPGERNFTIPLSGKKKPLLD